MIKKEDTQKIKFIQSARQAGCDESEVAFEGKLRRIAKAKSKPLKKGKHNG